MAPKKLGHKTGKEYVRVKGAIHKNSPPAWMAWASGRAHPQKQASSVDGLSTGGDHQDNTAYDLEYPFLPTPCGTLRYACRYLTGQKAAAE